MLVRITDKVTQSGLCIHKITTRHKDENREDVESGGIRIISEERDGAIVSVRIYDRETMTKFILGLIRLRQEIWGLPDKEHDILQELVEEERERQLEKL